MTNRLISVVCGSALILATAAYSQSSPPNSDQAKRIQMLVDRAAELVDTKGKEALSEFRQRGSEWFSGDTYIFAYASDGTVVLNPAFPAREGHAYHGEKDKKGKAFHDEIIKTAQTKGSGWVDYWLPKPGQTEPSQKWSYVKAVKAEGGRCCRCRFLSRVTGSKGHKSKRPCDVRFGSKADIRL